MTKADFINIIKEAGIPVAYYQFRDPPTLPFMIYFYPASDDVMADNTNYVDRRSARIELYSNTKDFALEENVDGILKSNNVTYRKSEDYIESEHMYMVLYETEVIIHE